MLLTPHVSKVVFQCVPPHHLLLSSLTLGSPKTIPWFVSDVTRKDWDWLLNICVYGHLFKGFSNEEMASLRKMGERWKQYEKEGRWVYESHPFWITSVSPLSSCLSL